MKRVFSLIFAASLGIVSLGCGPAATNAPNTNSASNGNSVAPMTTPTPVACTERQNQAIIAAITDGVNADLSGIKLKINWDAKDCKVYLTGYTETIQNFKTLEKYSLGAPAVVTMDNQKLWLLKGETEKPDPEACADGWTKCGDICIPPQQQCNNGGSTVRTSTPKP